MVAKKPTILRAVTNKNRNISKKEQAESNTENDEEMVTEQSSEEVKKEEKDSKQHGVRKRRRRTKQKSKGFKVKLNLLGEELKRYQETKKQKMEEQEKKQKGTSNKKQKGSEDDESSSQRVLARDLNEMYDWGITLSGIPKNWKGDPEEIVKEYKKFDLVAYTLMRKNMESDVCQVLHMFFSNKEGMEKAVMLGPVHLLEKKLTLRTKHLWMLYIPGIPFKKSDEKDIIELKNKLPPFVYDVSIPKRSSGGGLGYAVAYVMDEDAQKNLLANPPIQLWGCKLYCCSKEDYFNRFVISITPKSVLKDGEIKKKIYESIKEMHVKCVFGPSNQLYFLDESSVETVLKKSNMVVEEKSIKFVRLPPVRFVVKNIKRGIEDPEYEIGRLLEGVNAFNLKYEPRRCKATFEVPADEVRKCVDLHRTVHKGRELIVLPAGSEELKSTKQKSKEKFQKLCDSVDIPSTERQNFSKVYHQLKKVQYRKKKNAEKKNSLRKSNVLRKIGNRVIKKHGKKAKSRR